GFSCRTEREPAGTARDDPATMFTAARVSTSSTRRKFTLKGGKNVRSWNHHIQRRRSFFQLSGGAYAISSHVGYMVRCDQAVPGNLSPSNSARPRLWYRPIFDGDRKATASHCDRP